MTTTRCSSTATRRYMRRHSSTVKLLTETHSGAFPRELLLCDEHADLIDDTTWLLVEVVNHGDVASALRRADKQCQWEDDGFGEGGAS